MTSPIKFALLTLVLAVSTCHADTATLPSDCIVPVGWSAICAVGGPTTPSAPPIMTDDQGEDVNTTIVPTGPHLTIENGRVVVQNLGGPAAPISTPEPSTIAMLLVALTGLLMRKRPEWHRFSAK